MSDLEKIFCENIYVCDKAEADCFEGKDCEQRKYYDQLFIGSTVYVPLIRGYSNDNRD